MVVHQKGANGLVAEYQCAVVLNRLLAENGVRVLAAQDELQDACNEAVAATPRGAGDRLTTPGTEETLF